MTTLFAIRAVVTTEVVQSGSTWLQTTEVPTFYLHADAQNVLDEAHARRLARAIVDPAGILALGGGTVAIDVEQVDVAT